MWASSHLLHRTISPLATVALQRHRTARIAGDTCLANSTDVRRYICGESVGQSVVSYTSAPTTWPARNFSEFDWSIFEILRGKFQNSVMPKTVAKLEDFEVLLTIGTGSFGTCRKVRRRADGKVSSCIRDGLARQTGRGLGGD